MKIYNFAHGNLKTLILLYVISSMGELSGVFIANKEKLEALEADKALDAGKVFGTGRLLDAEGLLDAEENKAAQKAAELELKKQEIYRGVLVGKQTSQDSDLARSKTQDEDEPSDTKKTSSPSSKDQELVKEDKEDASHFRHVDLSVTQRMKVRAALDDKRLYQLYPEYRMLLKAELNTVDSAFFRKLTEYNLVAKARALVISNFEEKYNAETRKTSKPVYETQSQDTSD